MEIKYFQISTNFLRSVQMHKFRDIIGQDWERAENILIDIFFEIMKKGGQLELTTLNSEITALATYYEIPQSEIYDIIHAAVESGVFWKDKFEQNILQPCELLAMVRKEETK